MELSQHITLPDKEFEYFTEWDTHPFQGQANGFSWVNAWRLVEASMLAYGDQAFAADKSRHIVWTVDIIPPQEKERAGFPAELTLPNTAQCLLLYNDEFVIAAFRGTEFPLLDKDRYQAQIKSMWADVNADLEFPLQDFHGKGCVHRGFYKGFEEVRIELEKQLKNLAPRAVWFTGHSMGGAIATLASVYFTQINPITNVNVQGLYTFGSPLVGDNDFKPFGSHKHSRLVNNNDFVANLTLQNYVFPIVWFDYVHTDQEMRLDSNGILIKNSKKSDLMERLWGAVKQPFRSLRDFVFKGELTLPVDAFNDHIPRNYAANIRRNL